MTSTELKLFLGLLPYYIDHLKKNHNSLLGKILGVFTIKAEKIHEVHVMVMENTLRIKDTANLKYIFDLKGSTVDRCVTGQTFPSTTLKDRNFLIADEKIKDFTKLNSRKAKQLSTRMKIDIEFLRSHNLMDYSLLLGIEKSKVKQPNASLQFALDEEDKSHLVKASILLKNFSSITRHIDSRAKNPFEEVDIGELFAESHRFKNGRKIFHISIIDYLQEWNLSKKSERLAKTLLMKKDGDKLSAIEPNAYAVRFRNFMN